MLRSKSRATGSVAALCRCAAPLVPHTAALPSQDRAATACCLNFFRRCGAARMGSAPCKPRRAMGLPGPVVCLALGLMLGLTCRLPIKELMGQRQAAAADALVHAAAACQPSEAGSSAGAAFGSFIYPTWPATDLRPAVSVDREASSRDRASGGMAGGWRRLWRQRLWDASCGLPI